MSQSRGLIRIRSLFATVLLCSGAAAQDTAGESTPRYDARIEYNRSFTAAPRGIQARTLRAQEVQGLAASVEEMSIETDDTTGAVSSLASQRGYLTGAARGKPMDLAMSFVRNNVAALGLTPADLEGYIVSDVVYSRVTGATHIYLQQQHQGIPVHYAQLHINVNRDGRIISVNNSFLPDIANAARGVQPKLQLPAAVGAAARFSGMQLPAQPQALGTAAAGPQRASRVAHAGISRSPINGKLMWLPIRQGEARLVWNFQVDTLDGEHSHDYTVDADTGAVWTRFDFVAHAQYRVYRQPFESPNHTAPLPPADGRTLVVNPANGVGSPFGWHDTNGVAGAEFTTTQGNNGRALISSVADPNGGAALNFDFPLTSSNSAQTTNLFYWLNTIHDVQYLYGFDEAAGNFQVNNYGRGGLGNDPMDVVHRGTRAAGGSFSVVPDGRRGVINVPGGFEAGTLVHEYGHGISDRLVGGPSTAGCMIAHSQTPSEGFADWLELVYTARASDTGATPRGVSTYALGQPITGPGLRGQRYSTDPAVNNWTYASIRTESGPHGVGSVWAQALWEVYWKLVSRWGFSENLFNATGSAGNQRAMLYATEGMKNTACRPTLTQARDGFIQAATDIRSGEDVCRIWEAFAAFGLGTNAVSGGRDNTAPLNGFSVPASCGGPANAVVFTDDFETNLGWQINPSGTDTATAGRWERGDPQQTTRLFAGFIPLAVQLGDAVSGVNTLVTGRLPGADFDANDVDGGTTSIRSPAIALPTGQLTLAFNYYVSDAGVGVSNNFLRVTVIGTTSRVVLNRTPPVGDSDPTEWQFFSTDVSSFAGQSIRILIEAADTGTPHTVEAAIDDMVIVRR